MYLLHWIPEVDWVASNDLCIRLNIQPNSINSCMCLSDIFIFENDVLLSAGFEPTLLVHCRTHWMSILYIRLSYYDVDIPSLYNITSAGFPKQVLLYVCTFNQVSEINWISTSRKIFIETCFSNTLYQHTQTHTHVHARTHARTHAHTHTHARTHAHTHTHTHTHTFYNIINYSWKVFQKWQII
jgi:hypothetical protein